MCCVGVLLEDNLLDFFLVGRERMRTEVLKMGKMQLRALLSLVKWKSQLRKKDNQKYWSGE